MEDKKKGINRYKCHKLLGEGSFGKAFLVSCVDDSLAVVKTIFLDGMSEDELKEAFLESKILEKLDHPNIIKFREVYLTHNPRLTMCLVMDYADGGDLETKLKSQKGKQQQTETQILDLFTQICLAIKHIHDRKILHRDLKSQNIFMNQNGSIKLGDFGIAKCLKNTVDIAKTVVGTPYYFSPEIIQNKPYSFKSDIWSLGILLYEMCALKMPFDGSNIAALSMKIVKGNFNPLPTSFTRDIRALISSMLHVDINKRPSINEILRNNLIKTRIRNFLSDSEYEKEFLVNEEVKIKMMRKYENKLVNDSKKSEFKSINTLSNENKKSESKSICIPANEQRKSDGKTTGILDSDSKKPENKYNILSVSELSQCDAKINGNLEDLKKIEKKINNNDLNDPKRNDTKMSGISLIDPKKIEKKNNNNDENDPKKYNNNDLIDPKRIDTKMSGIVANELKKNDKKNNNIDANDPKKSDLKINAIAAAPDLKKIENKTNFPIIEQKIENNKVDKLKEVKNIDKILSDDVLNKYKSKNHFDVNSNKKPIVNNVNVLKPDNSLDVKCVDKFKEGANKQNSNRSKLNINPNFMKKSNGDVNGIIKDLEIEIFEPKKRSIFNPDAYKIIRTPKEEILKRNENEIITNDISGNDRKENLSNSNENKIIINGVDSNRNKNNEENTPRINKNVIIESNKNIKNPIENKNSIENNKNPIENKNPAELKKFLKEMREKKRKNENTGEENIVIKWAEPKKINYNNIKNETCINQEENKNLEEEKNISLKIIQNDNKLKEKLDPNENLVQLSYANSNYENDFKKLTTNNNHESSNEIADTQYSDYSRLEAYKIELENILGDYVFASLYRKIDNLVYFF